MGFFFLSRFNLLRHIYNKMSKLKIAIQKSGRLSEKSLELLKECGIKLPPNDRKLKSSATNFPLEVLFLRDDDIPQYVEQGIADIGILGQNISLFKNEAADLLYHFLILLQAKNVKLEEIEGVLKERNKK